MLLTRDEMMELMANPNINEPKLNSTNMNSTINQGQLLDKDKKVISTNAVIDERGRFIMKPKHV